MYPGCQGGTLPYPVYRPVYDGPGPVLELPGLYNGGQTNNIVLETFRLKVSGTWKTVNILISVLLVPFAEKRLLAAKTRVKSRVK